MLTDRSITNHEKPLPVTELIKASSTVTYSEGGFYQIDLLKLYDGVHLLCWYSQFNLEQQLHLEDDSDNVYFSFNLSLNGAACCHFADNEEPTQHPVFQGCGGISYHPSHRGSYIQQGELQNLTLIIAQEALPRFIHNHEELMTLLSQQDGYISHLYLPELHATARQVYDEMKNKAGTRNPLWFQGKGLVLASLFMETLAGLAKVHRISSADQYRLIKLKNHLLTNLSQPPTIAQLAKHYGFSASTLTRSFRRAFDCSINEMLQRERMSLAHQKLLRSEASVTQVATDIGYSNISHFSNLFRKHFGVLPGQVKREHAMPILVK